MKAGVCGGLFKAEDGAYVPLMESLPAPAPYKAIHLADLFRIAEWQDQIAWKPFREGVEIYPLYQNGPGGPSAVLLRYRSGARVARHLHEGYEHILVLAGSQEDQNGEITTGTLSISAPGTEHSLLSKGGCIILAIYEKPVKFL